MQIGAATNRSFSFPKQTQKHRNQCLIWTSEAIQNIGLLVVGNQIDLVAFLSAIFDIFTESLIRPMYGFSQIKKKHWQWIFLCAWTNEFDQQNVSQLWASILFNTL